MKSPSHQDALGAIPEPEARLTRAVVREADRRRQAVYLVGGPVRDLLLGRALRDVDLIVEPRGDAGAEALARAAAPEGAQVVAHGRFGTVHIECEGVAIDVATVRSERYERPGALPDVAEGSLDDDLRRRDFTVNALALPLSAAARRRHAGVIDPGGACADLAAKVLRIFHARSFHDDPTRALRAARLAERLGFRLARGSRSALSDALRDGAFGAVSGERVRREFERLFWDAHMGLDPPRALRRLAEWHVLGGLEPGLGLPRTTVAPLRRVGRAIAAPPWPSPRARDWIAGLAVWLADVDATLRRRTLRRLAVRGEVAKRIASFPRDRERWLRALARARGRGPIDSLLAPIDGDRLLALYACAPPTGRRRISRWAVEDRPRRLPVSGTDLVAQGLSGPAVGAALARIRIAHLDGTVKSREDALALAREMQQRGRKKGRRKR